MVSKRLQLLAVTTALFAPSFSFAQQAPALPTKDAEYWANGSLETIGAMKAYLRGYTGKGIIVAVVDTGLDVNHPEFANRISEALYNFGYDKDPSDVSHSLDHNGKPIGHGTHVAGIIGAGRNGTGMQGVAYEATLLPLRAISAPGHVDEDLPDEAIDYAVKQGAKVLNGSYGPRQLEKWLKDKNGNYVYENGKPVIQPHYKDLGYQPIWASAKEAKKTYDALKNAAESDVVLVFSAGNANIDQPSAAKNAIGDGMFPLITSDNTQKGLYRFIKNSGTPGFDRNNEATWEFLDPSDPSIKDLDFSDLAGSLITVVAVGKNGRIADYSNRCGLAAAWCLAAPGGNLSTDRGIYSTWPTADGSYKNLQGTSMAAPHVSGAAAVVRSAFPYMNARQTIETILTTTTKEGYEAEAIYGQGLLNLGKAIDGPGEFRYAGVFDVDTKGYSSIWANSISGVGDLTKRGEGALVLTGQNSTYSGPTTVLGGTLAVDGSIVSAVSVSGKGTLAGTGSVGNLVVGDGGTVSPGSVLDPSKTIAALTVNGDFVQQAGSVYQADAVVPGDASDLINVTGRATIESGASVEVVRYGAGKLSIGARYAILTAAGGVDGAYSSLTGNLVTDSPFIDFDLTYDPAAVYLGVDRTATAFADVGTTFNQRSVAAAAEALGSGNAIHDNVLFLTAGESRNAFSLLSGEVHASAKGALVEDSHFVRDAASERIRAAFAGVGGSSAPVTTYGSHGAEAASSATDKLAVWGRGFGAWGDLGGDGNAARLDYSTGGFLAGADTLVGDAWRLGVLAGYSHTSFDLDDRGSSGSSDNYHLGLYAGTQWERLGFRSGLAYSWHRLDTQRAVAFTGFSDSLSSSYDSGTFQAFGELGYRIDTAVAAFEPYANLAYVHLNTDGFQEKGGAAALHGSDQSTDTTFSTLGLRTSSTFQLGSMSATAHGGIGWRHAFGDVTPEARLAFTGGTTFDVEGTPIAEDAALIEAGFDMNVTEKATLGLAYQGQLASDAQEHGFNAKLAVQF